MNVVDSSGWIEFIGGGANAEFEGLDAVKYIARKKAAK